jgi:F-type H+-transporting ATPase subunit gamma
MVASSKLRKADHVILNTLPYSRELNRIMATLLTNDFSSPLSQVRPPQNVAIIVFSSDTSLCGAFNANASHELKKTVNTYSKTLDSSHIFVYTIGKKVYESFKKTGFPITKNYENLAGKNDYKPMADLATSLIEQFKKKQIDRVEVLFHHFKGIGVQRLVKIQLLPVILPAQEKNIRHKINYIHEPSLESLLNVLIPKSIRLRLYTALLDSNASEHAARMMAMQIATDNANELVVKLTLQYNKSRQQAITNELLDLIGGSVT